MTKKDYIIIAKCINEAYAELMDHDEPYDGYYEYAVNRVVSKLINEFPKDNPAFDLNRFKDAVYKIN